MGTPVRMMMTPTPHTMGSEMKLKTSRNAQKTKYVAGTRRFTWESERSTSGAGPRALLPHHPGGHACHPRLGAEAQRARIPFAV